MIDVTQGKKQAIWAEIIAAGKAIGEEKKDQSDNEITVFEFVQETGLSTSDAREFLNKQCAEGKLQRRKRWIDSRNAVCYLYSPVE